MGVVRHGLLYRRPWPCGLVRGNALVHHTMGDSEYARFAMGGGELPKYIPDISLPLPTPENPLPLSDAPRPRPRTSTLNTLTACASRLGGG